MSFVDWTVEILEEEFHVEVRDLECLFRWVKRQESSSRLRDLIAEYLPLALDCNTEKANSELLIVPVLLEVRSRLGRPIGFFSGLEFEANHELGLVGKPDFLISRTPLHVFIHPPVVLIVEAVRGDLESGISRRLAAMLGASLFNDAEGDPAPLIYGVVTSGTSWRFFVLDSYRWWLWCDPMIYLIDEDLPRILGILSQMVEGDGEAEITIQRDSPGTEVN